MLDDRYTRHHLRNDWRNRQNIRVGATNLIDQFFASVLGDTFFAFISVDYSRNSDVAY